MMYRKIWQDQSELPQNIMNLEKLLESHFGDSLCARRPYYPAANIKHEGANTNVTVGSAMEVDVLNSSVMDTGSNDFELDYRNWTAIAKIPTHVPPLFLSTNRDITSTFSDRRMTVQANSQLSSVFEIPVRCEYYSNTIHFNFAGANPVPKRKLKRRRLDPTHAQLDCPSVYFSKSCQVSCIGKSANKQQKNIKPRSLLLDLTILI